MKTVVWTNGTIHTLNENRPQATAMVALGETLIYVGDDDEALRIAGPEAAHHDLGGRCVVPGFNDNHTHVVIYGENLASVSLAGLDADAIVAALKKAHPVLQRGEFVTAFNWDLPACPHPHRSILDAAFPDNPVLLSQFGGHGLWINSAALSLLDLEALQKANPLGEIGRDAQGEPTGILKEMANNPLMRSHFQKLFLDTKFGIPRVKRALERFASYGITSVQDNSWFLPMVWQFSQLKRKNELTCRVTCWTHGEMAFGRVSMAFALFDKRWIRRGPWKYFLDGTFTTRTAALHDPYVGEPENRGQGKSVEEIRQILRFLTKTGRQGAFHAIGDRVISNFIEAATEVQSEFPQCRTLRMRLEHAQLLRPGDAELLRNLGIYVSAQPSALSTPEKDVSLVGEERALNAYPHRTLLDADVDLSFGSDIPGEPSCNPLEAICRVSTRPGPERITPLEALQAFTTGSARVEGTEDVKGRLKKGYYADFAVLDADLLAIDPAKIAEVKVVQTVVGGRIVWGDSHD